jgi:septal ring-binding cell division protein DamX
MRDNKRTRQRFDVSLEGRHVVTFIAVLLAVVGAAFLAGVTVGRRLSAGAAAAARAEAAADPLAALDEPPAAVPREEPPTRYSFHERLTRDAARAELVSAAPAAERLTPAAATPPRPTPSTASAAPAAPAPADPASAAPPPAKATATAAAAAPSPAGPTVVSATSEHAAASGQQAGEHRPAAERAQKPAAGAASGGPFTIQLGATRDKGEAARIAERYRSWRPRIVGAVLPGKGRWYRVQVGSFGTREAADRYLRDLTRQTRARGFVTAAR